MKCSEVDPTALKHAVLEDMERYLSEYTIPPVGTTFGTPWPKERIASGLERMRALLVEPYLSTYFCEDKTMFDAEHSLPAASPAWVVAEDGNYRLMFDPEAEDYVLVSGSAENGWGSFGVRGDAPTTFLAR
ncbi:hypothetical protein [Variovorax sp. PCZ-1]|uniref:hypothetical protein n=1 Tax=Variovorax sp. PCZ-1 TaxID=2835533 RepID=UPI001BCBB70F|nr:hypothetical protein [Variovorax sp. PCZ-1]MBS7808455.1 hypothetical protein [Variovorax sp. PCZ-1]